MPLRLKSALFVDFDNIFIGLKQDDLRAAQDFGRGVRRWLDWIQTKMLVPTDDDGRPAERQILVRRCYGNPETFSDYRGWFTRAGFQVVDCPPLTGSGKNSADIVMVMDILDVLGHSTRFDEFVIMSADADFTPLMQRLRMYDRRTVAIVAGNAAAAYRASCDLVVPDEVFVERALEVPAGPPPVSALRAASASAVTPKAAPALLDAIAARVYEVASAGGEVAGSRLPAIYRDFREFTQNSNWLGFYSLRALTMAVVARRPDLRITDDDALNVGVNVPASTAGSDGAPGRAVAAGGGAGLRARIVELVREIVADAREPVPMARAAQQVIQTLGSGVLEGSWAGAGTFKHLLEEVDDPGLVIVGSPQPGFIFDPARHEPPAPDPAEARPENLAGLPDQMIAFIRRVSEVTGAPRLSPAQYAVLFELVAKEVEKAPFDLVWTSKTVRDQAQERGETLARIVVTFVLRGIGFAGYEYRRVGVEEAPDLARAFHSNVLNMLRAAQVALSEDERELLDDWLLSGAQPAGADAADSAEGDGPAWAAQEDVGAEGAPAWVPPEEGSAEVEPDASASAWAVPTVPEDGTVEGESTWAGPKAGSAGGEPDVGTPVSASQEDAATKAEPDSGAPSWVSPEDPAAERESEMSAPAWADSGVGEAEPVEDAPAGELSEDPAAETEPTTPAREPPTGTAEPAPDAVPPHAGWGVSWDTAAAVDGNGSAEPEPAAAKSSTQSEPGEAVVVERAEEGLPWLSSDLAAAPAPAAEPASPAAPEPAPERSTPPPWLFPPFSSGRGN
jgi:hypothetical protein